MPKHIAIVAGGWHWPGAFYDHRQKLPPGWKAHWFVVAHRSPDLEEVVTEKAGLTGIDAELYRWIPGLSEVEGLGWRYQEAPNIAGDWVFFNQWLELHDYREYDLILNCHDDTYWRHEGALAAGILHPGDWLILGNGRYPEAPDAYVRGSFEFWRPELLDLLLGQIPVGALGLTRVGQTDTPQSFEALSSWNAMGDPLRRFLVEQNLSQRVAWLSPYYRISEHVIEGERGLIMSEVGAPWSFRKGLERWPIQ